MKIRISILLAGMIILGAMSSSKKVTGPEVIKIDLDESNRPRLNISIKEIIPLETSKECMLGYAASVKHFDQKVYVLNNNRFQQPTLYVFKENGKFLRKTIQGKGPGEVIDPFAVAIDKKNSLVLLHDQSARTIMTFTPDLKFIKSEIHPRVYIMDFFPVDRDKYLVYYGIRDTASKGGRREFSYTLYTDGFSKTKNLNVILEGDKTAQGMCSPVSINGTEVLFVSPWDYHVYELVNDEARMRYFLDFGKYAFTPSELKNLSSEELYALQRAGKRVSFPYSFFKTDDFLVFWVSGLDKSMTFFQSAKNNKTYCIEDGAGSQQIPKCALWEIDDDGNCFGLVSPEDLMEFQKSSGKYPELKVTENDNPYIIFFKVSEPK